MLRPFRPETFSRYGYPGTRSKPLSLHDTSFSPSGTLSTNPLTGCFTLIVRSSPSKDASKPGSRGSINLSGWGQSTCCARMTPEGSKRSAATTTECEGVGMRGVGSSWYLCGHGIDVPISVLAFGVSSTIRLSSCVQSDVKSNAQSRKLTLRAERDAFVAQISSVALTDWNDPNS